MTASNQKLAEQISIQVGDMIAETTALMFARCEDEKTPLTGEQKRIILSGFINSVLNLPERVCHTLEFNDLTSDLINPDEVPE